MAEIRQIDNLFMTLSGDGATDLVCLGARVREGLSQISEMRMEFVSKSADFQPASMIGKRIKLETDQGFQWSGLVIQVEDLGLMAGGDVFAAELRPWLWVSTLGEENRIFQNLTTTEIVQDVLKPLGGAMDLAVATPRRTYCVQYKESNFAFISRLLEEDGIHYRFDYKEPIEKLVLAADLMTSTDKGMIPFTNANISSYSRAERDTIYEWSTRDRATSGKVTIWDYDFTKANTPLSATAVKTTSGSALGQTERYQSGGHFTQADAGTTLARIAAEGIAAQAVRATGLTNHADVRVGTKFKLKYPDRKAVEGVYGVVKATHYLRFDDGASGTELKRVNRNAEKIDFPEGMKLYETEFEVQPVETAYYPPKVTPWPEVPALLTATVTGPAGEEIYTDEYGRIRVEFPWDRKSQHDEKTSCWVRTVMPWTGKGYGFVAVPRIGMEVVIQFERGNIDRPICTGMLYNSTNMPPYALAAEMNKVVLRTQSTKNGSATNYHELSFDDTKGSELTYFQSEKNYRELVKANANINIGGSLTQVVHVNTTETVETGERKLTVAAGSETTEIAVNQDHKIGANRLWEVGADDKLKVGANRDEQIGSNHTEAVGANFDLTIGGNMSETVGGNVTITYGGNEQTAVNGSREHAVGGAHSGTVGGDQALTVGGDQSVTIGGAHSESVGMGQEVEVGLGQSVSTGMGMSFDVGTSFEVDSGLSSTIKAGTSVTISAPVSIELKVGASKIKIDPSGVTIEGPLIQIKGTGMIKASAPLVQTQASGMLILKGGVTMIN